MTWFHRRHRFSDVVLIAKVRGSPHISCLLSLTPNMRIRMSSISVTVGHKVDFKLAFLDQHGNPMLSPVTPDSPPVWIDTNSAVGTLTAAADGLTAEETAVSAGTDTVTVSLMVGGAKFEASVDVVVQPEAQVLTSVQILATVV